MCCIVFADQQTTNANAVCSVKWHTEVAFSLDSKNSYELGFCLRWWRFLVSKFGKKNSACIFNSWSYNTYRFSTEPCRPLAAPWIYSVNSCFRHLSDVSATPQPQFRFKNLSRFCPASNLEHRTTLCSWLQAAQLLLDVTYDSLLSVCFYTPSDQSTNAPWFLPQKLALYKSFIYLLTY